MARKKNETNVIYDIIILIILTITFISISLAVATRHYKDKFDSLERLHYCGNDSLEYVPVRDANIAFGPVIGASCCQEITEQIYDESTGKNKLSVRKSCKLQEMKKGD